MQTSSVICILVFIKSERTVGSSSVTIYKYMLKSALLTSLATGSVMKSMTFRYIIYYNYILLVLMEIKLVVTARRCELSW
jgi:hypothetical protein